MNAVTCKHYTYIQCINTPLGNTNIRIILVVLSASVNNFEFVLAIRNISTVSTIIHWLMPINILELYAGITLRTVHKKLFGFLV